MKGWYVEGYQQWSSLFGGCNWYDFTFVKVYGEFAPYSGRWEFEATLMGMPYKSFFIHGFDNYKNKFTTAFVSNMDTALITLTGVVVDPTGNVTVEYGELDEPTMHQVGKALKTVTRRKDDNHFVVEVWDLGIGEAGAIVLEFAYSRKKVG